MTIEFSFLALIYQKTKNMKTLQLKSIEMINELKGAIVNNQITILNKVYSVKNIGNHFIKLIGAKGAEYTVSTSPKCVVVEDKNCNVYFLMDKRGVSVDFTFFDGNTIDLVTLN